MKTVKLTKKACDLRLNIILSLETDVCAMPRIISYPIVVNTVFHVTAREVTFGRQFKNLFIRSKKKKNRLLWLFYRKCSAFQPETHMGRNNILKFVFTSTVGVTNALPLETSSHYLRWN